DEEEVRGRRGAGEGFAGRRLVGEIAGEMLDVRHVRRAVAGDADDTPAAGRLQPVREGAAADAADAEDHRRVVCHGGPGLFNRSDRARYPAVDAEVLAGDVGRALRGEEG